MVCEAKKRLRAELREAAVTSAGTGEPRLPEIIAARIERMPAFEKARMVAIYYPLADEVSLLPLAERWKGVKKFALPAIENDRMVFREYTGEADLVGGAFGIARPRRAARLVPPREIEFMIVPGMAFDRDGRRLGRGKGFYDRYLAQPEASDIYKVGVCPPQRLIDQVPCEPHDAVMDEIVTAPHEGNG